jgi:hypothetical protein
LLLELLELLIFFKFGKIIPPVVFLFSEINLSFTGIYLSKVFLSKTFSYVLIFLLKCEVLHIGFFNLSSSLLSFLLFLLISLILLISPTFLVIIFLNLSLLFLRLIFSFSLSLLISLSLIIILLLFLSSSSSSIISFIKFLLLL